MTNDPAPDVGPHQIASSTLLDRVRDGEVQAWQTFVRLYAPLVYHWCRQAGLRAEDAAAVGREAFRAVLDGAARFSRDEPGSLRRWVRGITRDKAREFVRERTGLQETEGPPAAPPPVQDDADPAEERILYRRALDLVLADSGPEARQAFRRVVFDRQDPGDVAADLGLSLDAVCLAKSRVLRRLRGVFTDLIEPSPE